MIKCLLIHFDDQAARAIQLQLEEVLTCTQHTIRHICVQGVHLEQVHSALTQQNVHGYRGSTVTVHNILSDKAVSGYAPGAIRVNQCMTEIARMCTDKSFTLHDA